MGHPLLSQKSLMRLSSLLTMEVCQRVMIDLGMSADRITITRREANKQYMPEEFLLLLTWCQGVRGTKDDCDVIKDIEVALQHIGRRDLALKIAKARKEKREFDNQDVYD
ncbi:uncharacterized protein LOC125379934 [Haliotis rufescens]|uniref:uncharacterized protein LOC125379934 n=1 Tax=Haliotis rufescens TaxID=6454 RepID=UPI00201EC373|nr:uncharacterized protein LOC125379934 [Haliotis rufescens]